MYSTWMYPHIIYVTQTMFQTIKHVSLFIYSCRAFKLDEKNIYLINIKENINAECKKKWPNVFVKG